MAETPNLGITELTEGQSQKEITINTAFEQFDIAIAGRLTKDVAGSADVTLTAEEWRHTMFEFTGNTTADIDIIVPDSTKRFSVFNNTTGPATTMTIKTATGTGVVMVRGEHMAMEQNGADVVALSGGGGGGGNTTLTGLTDVPDSYAGQAGKVLAVKTDETGTEFIAAPTGGGGGDGIWSREDAGSSTLLSTIIAFWDLEEATGDRVDSVSAIPLVPTVGAPAISNGPGKIGQCLYMNGTSGTYLSVADNATFSAGPDMSFTLACWVWVNDTGSNMGFVGKGSLAVTSNNCEYMLWQYSGQWNFEVGSGSSFINLASTFTPVANQWCCLIGWYDHAADLQFIQVNNGTPTQIANTAGSFDGPEPFQVGRTAGFSSQSLNGRIDLIAFDKRVWTPAERAEYWNFGNGLTHPFVLPARIAPAVISDKLVLAASPTTSERLEVDGGVKLGMTDGTADGTIRWTGTDFEGRKGGVWVSLTT